MSSIERLRKAAESHSREYFGPYEWPATVEKEDLRELLGLLNALEHQVEATISDYENTVIEMKALSEMMSQAIEKISK